MRRPHWLLILFGLPVMAAMVPGLPALIDSRDRKIEVYRAFADSYAGNQPINLASEITRFGASNRAILACAPTVLGTTAISRHLHSPGLSQEDFPTPQVRIVDPRAQAVQVRAHDPGANITDASDIEGAVRNAFAAGLLEVSDVGFDLTSQHALLTYSFTCGLLCGHGGAVLFDRVDGSWVRSEKSCGSEWIS